MEKIVAKYFEMKDSAFNITEYNIHVMKIQYHSL